MEEGRSRSSSGSSSSSNNSSSCRKLFRDISNSKLRNGSQMSDIVTADRVGMYTCSSALYPGAPLCRLMSADAPQTVGKKTYNRVEREMDREEQQTNKRIVLFQTKMAPGTVNINGFKVTWWAQEEV